MPEVKKLTVQQAKAMLDRGEDVLFADARNPQAWGSAAEKLPGAVRVPAGEVRAHLDELPRDRPIIAYCT